MTRAWSQRTRLHGTSLHAFLHRVGSLWSADRQRWATPPLLKGTMAGFYSGARDSARLRAPAEAARARAPSRTGDPEDSELWTERMKRGIVVSSAQSFVFGFDSARLRLLITVYFKGYLFSVWYLWRLPANQCNQSEAQGNCIFVYLHVCNYQIQYLTFFWFFFPDLSQCLFVFFKSDWKKKPRKHVR